jgi:REP element-mobilizing transposase RayT
MTESRWVERPAGSLERIALPTERRILEGHLMPDHVQMCIAIPPKYPVASVIILPLGVPTQ